MDIIPNLAPKPLLSVVGTYYKANGLMSINERLIPEMIGDSPFILRSRTGYIVPRISSPYDFSKSFGIRFIYYNLIFYNFKYISLFFYNFYILFDYI